MRVEQEAVDIFLPVDHPPEFGQNKSRAGHGGIDMKPYVIFAADFSYGP